MKYLLLTLLFSVSFSAMAEIDILAICHDQPLEQPLVIIDDGFCSNFLETETGPIRDEELDKWKIRFYASHSFTSYFNSDIAFKSTRYNVEIKDYEWAERSSRHYFLPSVWKEEGNNPFNWIDEPTNTFVMSIEKDGHEFFLSMFHPKFLQAQGQVKYMVGTIDGTAVDGIQDVNKPFDGYDQTPGESELVGNQNTHLQMTFEIGYGHRFTLLDTQAVSISYVPSVAVGVMTGKNFTVMVQENQWWDYEDGRDPFKIQGVGGSVTNRIEINSPKEYFGIFYENKLGFYKQEHGFMDGTQKYNLGFMGNSVGIKFMIYNPNNHKK